MSNPYVCALELAAFFVSLLCLKQGGLTNRLLVFLLLLTVINEWWLVPVLAKQQHIFRNIFYNVFSLADIAIWTAVFFIIHSGQRWRIAIAVLGLGCLLYSLCEILFIKSWRAFHTDSMRVFSISMIVFCLLYFYAQFRKAYHNLTADWLFWICTACFMFHALLFVSLTTQSRPDYFGIPNAQRFFFILHNVSNTLYYALLITAFLVCCYRSSKQAPA